MCWRAVALAVGGLALGSVAGCILELDDAIACGDAYVDRSAGEECDPGDERSYIGACSSELGIDVPGACDPATCRLDLNVCFPLCGNRKLDLPVEECEPSLFAQETDPGDVFGRQLECSGIVAIGWDKPYADGNVEACLDTCRYDRSACSFCGDGTIDATFEPHPEVCDRFSEDKTAKNSACLNACVSADAPTEPPQHVVCNLACAGDCRGFALPEGEELVCCLGEGEAIRQDIDCCTDPELGAVTCPNPHVGG